MNGQVNERVKNKIEKHFSKNGCKNIRIQKYDSRKSTNDGKANFFGCVQHVQVNADNKGKPETIWLIVKEAPKTSNQRENLRIDLMYKREIIAYTKLFPIYKAIQKGLSEESRFRFVELYTCSESELKEYVVLEDISLSYSVNVSKVETADYEFTKAAVRELAKFHGLSFVFEKKYPQQFEEIKNDLFCIVFNEAIEGLEGLKAFADLMSAKLRELFKDMVEYPALERFTKNTYSNVCNCFVPGKYDVILHGDFWKNNILYQRMGEEITKVVLIDYQLMNIGSPARDLLYFIFLCTSQKTRREHYEQILNTYHESLGHYLNIYNMDVSVIFPRWALDEEMRTRGAAALGFGIIQLVFMTSLGNEITETSETLSGKVLQDLNSPGAKLFQDRFGALLQDCVYYGFI